MACTQVSEEELYVWDTEIRPAVEAAFRLISGDDPVVDVVEFQQWLNRGWVRRRDALHAEERERRRVSLAAKEGGGGGGGEAEEGRGEANSNAQDARIWRPFEPPPAPADGRPSALSSPAVLASRRSHRALSAQLLARQASGGGRGSRRAGLTHPSTRSLGGHPGGSSRGLVGSSASSRRLVGQRSMGPSAARLLGLETKEYLQSIARIAEGGGGGPRAWEQLAEARARHARRVEAAGGFGRAAGGHAAQMAAERAAAAEREAAAAAEREAAVERARQRSQQEDSEMAREVAAEAAAAAAAKRASYAAEAATLQQFGSCGALV